MSLGAFSFSGLDRSGLVRYGRSRMALSLDQWVQREQRRHEAQGMGSHISSPQGLAVIAALVSTAQARSEAPRSPQEPRSEGGAPLVPPAA